MKLRGTLIALVVCLTSFAAADFMVAGMLRHTAPKQTIQSITSAPSNIDELGIGNSLMAAAFDPSALEKPCEESGRKCVVVNGGLGASGVIEHLALTRLALRHHTVRTVIYGFFDQQMASTVADKNSDLIGNRAVLYYLEPKLTLEYAHFDLQDRLAFAVCRHIALLRERGSIWAKVERLRRQMGSVGLPSQETDRFGQKADFALLEATDSQSFAHACEKVIQSRQFLSAPVRTLLQQARERGAQVVVVEMPMHPSHLRRFYDQEIWEEFRTDTRHAVEADGASYLNASGWIPDASLYSDNLHLSKEGAQQFSTRLAAYLDQRRN